MAKLKAVPGKFEAPSALLMMHALPDPVVGFNRRLGVGFSNHAAQAFFGLSEKQFLDKDMAGLLDDRSAVFASVEGTVRKNQTVTLHDISLGKKVLNSIVVTTVEPDTWYLMVIREQPLQLARERNEKAKHSLKSAELVAKMLAHEIRNPLAGIRGAAQLLGKGKLSDDDRELASLIGRETLRIQGLVDRFNIFDEAPYSQYKPVNLHEVLNHVARVAKAEYGTGIEISEHFDPSLPDVHGHFDHLVQAKLNLIKNAAEAFPDKKGKIFLRTYYDNAAEYHPERPEKLPLCIEIEDNGQGITEEELVRIFQPYFTTKANGQGLGLPVVSKIVDDHGGTISVTSRPGKTVFKINLPVSTERSKS